MSRDNFPTQPAYYVKPDECKKHQWYDMADGVQCYKCGTMKDGEIKAPALEPVKPKAKKKVVKKVVKKVAKKKKK